MTDLPAARDAHEFIATLDEINLARFHVVGTYTRYDETVRNALQDARQNIVAGFDRQARKRENHLIWAAPGTGKTYFVQQVAASLPSEIRYHELNLAKCTEFEFRSGLGGLDGHEACLCLVDEVDVKPREPWPFEVLLPYLDAAVERGARFVFVLAGSSGAGINELKQRITARPKGGDLLSRIPTGHEYEIGPMSLEDRVLIVLSQLRQAGLEGGREIRAVEKLGLYYVALNPRLANARQLREFAVRAVERVPRSDDRVKYDHLFMPGDPENKAFWVQASPVTERLVNAFVTLAGDRVGALPPRNGFSLALSGAAAPPTIGTHPRTNLPRHLTSFIGRGREIAEVKRLLPTTGLVTLTGSAGVGKTRLALRVAADVVDQYPHGVWVAELGALSDPALVPKTVATALDIPEQPDRALTETLRDYLRPKSVLLVLDNCEHLVSVCADLVDVLLTTCPSLRIVVTSREPLGIPGEVIWRVSSLSVPSLRQPPPIDELTQYEAVHLFIDRAALSQPGFRLTGGNAAAVAQVVHRLDGIPLAIELAAARVKALPVDVIAQKLDDRFRLLAGGRRTGLRHHQTLRATLDWSHDLLSEPERVLLRRLSVFAGGFTVDAAEHVCAGDGHDDGDVLDRLTQLVDKSLVVFDEGDGQARYRLLESVRQYGSERVLEAGETSDVRRRHRDWYLQLAEPAESGLRGPEMKRWVDRLETEHDNFRAALEWSTVEPGGAEAGLRLAGLLWWFWYVGGHDREGRKWLESALARRDAAPPAVLPAAIIGAMYFAIRQNDRRRTAELGEQGLAVCRRMGDKHNTALLLTWLGFVARREGDYERATTLLQDGLAVARDVGDGWTTGLVLGHLGNIAREQGDGARAIALHGESLALSREMGYTSHIAFNLGNLGNDALQQDDYARVGSYFIDGLKLSQQLGHRDFTRQCLDGLAAAACGQGQYERAARLFGAADALRETIGHYRSPVDQAAFERRISATRQGLGDSAFNEAWAQGQAMKLEQAIEHALSGGPASGGGDLRQNWV